MHFKLNNHWNYFDNDPKKLSWMLVWMNEITRQLTKVILLNTKEQYKKERSTHAGNVTIRCLSLGVSLNTSVQYMKGKSTHVGNATTGQLQRIISLDISKHYMKGKTSLTWMWFTVLFKYINTWWKQLSVHEMWLQGKYKGKSHSTKANNSWRKKYHCRE